MKLSPKEEVYFNRWMYEEGQLGVPIDRVAQKLCQEHGVTPWALSTFLCACLPRGEEQYNILEGLKNSPPDPAVEWPWASKEEFEQRLAEAEDVCRRIEAENRARLP